MSSFPHNAGYGVAITESDGQKEFSETATSGVIKLNHKSCI
jgi:hypothetical protein